MYLFKPFHFIAMVMCIYLREFFQSTNNCKTNQIVNGNILFDFSIGQLFFEFFAQLHYLTGICTQMMSKLCRILKRLMHCSCN